MQEIYSGLREQLNKNYVQLAKVKGINRMRVILKHCFPNVLIQLGALSSVQLSVLIGGTFIVEEIFVLPGLGRLMIESVKTNDYMVLQGGILIIAMFVLLLNTLVDFLFKYFDPRLRID
jgi:ABC-type dipeptide/oligopeptide/nickel transport system permease component